MKHVWAGVAATLIVAFGLGIGPAGAGKFLEEINASLQDIGGPSKGLAKKASAGKELPMPIALKFGRQSVSYPTKEAAGTIVIDPRRKVLYYVLGGGKAIRYGIGVGREGFGWHGVVYVGKKAEWPAWRPPNAMIERERKRGRNLPTYVAGGPKNPLGARALYLHNGMADSGYRIHGTSNASSIGRNVSSGCFRLLNPDVIDLYNRVRIGAKVVVL